MFNKKFRHKIFHSETFTNGILETTLVSFSVSYW